jgi:hypothetical protein
MPSGSNQSVWVHEVGNNMDDAREEMRKLIDVNREWRKKHQC